MRILALESSCDESAVAVYDDAAGLLAHEIHSQIDLHRVYGGVVPELASRDHVRRLLPLLRTALATAKTKAEEIDGVAYTAGPGLIGALLTGAALGRSLAHAWKVPAIAVHHLEGHLLAPLLEDNPPPFPHVAFGGAPVPLSVPPWHITQFVFQLATPSGRLRSWHCAQETPVTPPVRSARWHCWQAPSPRLAEKP